MKNYIFFITFIVISFNLFSQKYSKVKIFANQEEIGKLLKEGIPVDHGQRKIGQYIITDLSEKDIQKLMSLGYNFDVIINDVKKHYVTQNLDDNFEKNSVCTNNSNALYKVPDNFELPSTYGGYYKYNEMLQELDKMSTLYPNLISTKSPIHTFLTWENRPIYQIKISNNPNTDDGDPMVLYSAIHHAREPMSMSQLIFYMWYLLENYDTNPEVKYLVDNTQMIFVPCLNPDGYIYNETQDPNGGGMHRKNRNPNIGNVNVGVDLNRNYGYRWGTTGISSDPDNDTYPGIAAFSEPESQAMKWLVQNNPIRAALNAHTYGNMLLFPLGTLDNEFAAHHVYFQEISNHMTQYNHYNATKSSNLYPASGDSDDYMYMSDNGILSKDTVFAMTPEIGSSFWPARTEIISTCQEMVFTNLGLAHMVHKYYVLKEEDPLIIINSTGTFQHTIKKLGRQNGNATVSIEPLTNIASIGAPITYNLAILGVSNGSISYTLNPSIQAGDTIKYLLKINDGDWIKQDTIIKLFQDSDYEEVIFENGNTGSNWVGNWGLTSEKFYSPNQSFTDSPNSLYGNNSIKTFEYNQQIDLTNVVNAKATFYAQWDIEKSYDYCEFQVSNDNGASWINQCGLYTVSGSTDIYSIQPDYLPIWDGTRTSWVQEEINLSDYIGQQILVRFSFVSDSYLQADGFYFDDFKVITQTEETDLGLNQFNQNSIQIYPNPSNDQININGIQLNDKVIISDLMGKIMYQSDINTTNEISINTSNIKNGAYILKIQRNEKIHSEKIIINRF